MGQTEKPSGNDQAEVLQVPTEGQNSSPVKGKPPKTKVVLPPLVKNPNFQGEEFISEEKGLEQVHLSTLHKAYRGFSAAALEGCKLLVQTWKDETDRKEIQQASHKMKGSWS